MLVLSSQGAHAQSHTTQDTLWAKAVATAAANKNWMPTQWHETETISNKKGKIEETSNRLLRLGLAPDNGLDVQVIKATKNSQNNLEKTREEVEANRDTFIRDNLEDNLFDPSIQHTVTVKRSGEVKHIAGRACIGFRYIQTTQEGDWAGTAWLDAETGLPALVESAPQGLPIEEDGFKVLALTSITEYTFSSPEAWYPVNISIALQFEAKYAAFTYKGSSKTTITLSEYQRISP